MKSYSSYWLAEEELINRIISRPDFKTEAMHERLADGFELTDPLNNMNDRSNYDYARAFFDWIMSGEKTLSKELLDINPWVERFTDEKGLPENFSASYGWKIQEQLPDVIAELKDHKNSRRAYLNILYPDDHIIRKSKTTHEYPCTIGLHFFIRGGRLHCIANMRSNNCIKVMPYDVYNFTMLQWHVAEVIDRPIGNYYHHINSAHVFNGDARRWKEQKYHF